MEDGYFSEMVNGKKEIYGMIVPEFIDFYSGKTQKPVVQCHIEVKDNQVCEG